MSQSTPEIRVPFGYETMAVLRHDGSVRDQAHATTLMGLNEIEERFRQDYWVRGSLHRSDLAKLKGEYLVMDAFCAARVICSSELLDMLDKQAANPDPYAGDGGIDGMPRRLRKAVLAMRELGRDYSVLERGLNAQRMAEKIINLGLIIRAMEDLRHRTFALLQEFESMSSDMDCFEMGDRCEANTLCTRLILSLTALHRKTCHVANWDFMANDHSHATLRVA